MTTRENDPRSSGVALIVAAAILLGVGSFITFATTLGIGFSFTPDQRDGVIPYGCALVASGTLGPVLLRAGVRRRVRFRSQALVVGGLITALALLISGVPFAKSVMQVVHIETLRALPVTDEEKGYSVDDLRVEAELFLVRATDGLAELERPEAQKSTGREECQLGNLTPGSLISVTGERFFTTDTEDVAIDSIVAEWQSQGYETVEHVDPVNDARVVRIVGSDWLHSAEARWAKRIDGTPSEGYNILIYVETICVLDD